MGFAVQPGLYYTTKGAQTSDFSEDAGTGSKTALDYIEVPIVIRIHMGPLYVGAGPAIGLKLSCMNTPGATGTSTSTAPMPSARNPPRSAGFSRQEWNSRKFSLGGRADIGISNAIEAIQTGSTANVTYKTRTLSAVAAIRF